MKLLLASQSPRRRELLQQLGIGHRTLHVAVDEAVRPDESAATYVTRLAAEKAWAGWRAQPENGPCIVLAADTAVVVDGQILGKPRDKDDGVAMLALLSGRTHEVYTGVALVDGEQHTALSRSQVSFRSITPNEALAYWQSGEPADKAGGYAIQGLGALFISRLEGSYSGVMGLPLFETADLLQRIGFPLLQHYSTDGDR